jgi:hypothetical protein
VSGAIGFEMLGGWWASRHHLADRSEIYVLLSTAEECLEMLGATLFLHALLQPLIVEPREAKDPMSGQA